MKFVVRELSLCSSWGGGESEKGGIKKYNSRKGRRTDFLIVLNGEHYSFLNKSKNKKYIKIYEFCTLFSYSNVNFRPLDFKSYLRLGGGGGGILIFH